MTVEIAVDRGRGLALDPEIDVEYDDDSCTLVVGAFYYHNFRVLL